MTWKDAKERLRQGAQLVFTNDIPGGWCFAVLLSDIPGVPGFYVASGCCVTGISASPVLGKLLAEWIVDGAPSLDIASMHISRFDGAYQDVGALHQACEEVYGHYYALGWGKI